MRIYILLFLVVFPIAARAAEPANPTSSNTAAGCGATVTEGMQSVRRTLAASDPESQHLALACLAQIVAAMNDKIAALDAEVRHNSTGRVKVTAAPVQAGQR